MSDSTKSSAQRLLRRYDEATILSAAAMIRSGRRVNRTPGTGRPAIPTACRRCGALCPSARQAWRHKCST